jgi:translocation and assembly module TamB
MRRRWRRIALWSGAGLALLVLLLAGAVWLLLGTQGGTRWLFARLGALMPGAIEVARLDGPIRGPLDIRGLTYRREGLEVRVDHVHLEWRLRELLAKRLDVERLYAEGIHVIPGPPKEETKRGPLPDLNLRFNIIVRDARVRGLTIGSPGQPPFVVDRIDLATTAVGGRFHVDRLSVRAPLLDAEATGTLQPQGDYPVDLDLRWSARPPQMAELTGRGTFTGTLERLRVAQVLARPFPADLEVTLLQPFYDLRFAGRLRFSDLDPHRLRADLPQLPATGAVALEGTLDRFTAVGDVRGSVAPAGPVAVSYRAAKNGAEWRLERAEIALTGTPTRLVAQGRLTPGRAGFTLQGEASWRDLAWPPRGAAPVVTSPRGNARFAGTLDRYLADVEADLRSGALPPGHWRVAGQGDSRHFAFDRLQADLLSGRVVGRGEAAWKPRVRWRATLSGSGIDPAALAASFPGRLSFDARTEGELAAGGPVGRVDVTRIGGTLRGQPVAGSAALALAGSRYDLSQLDLSWSTARLNASGTLGKALDLGWNASLPNLAVALPEGGGNVEARGHLRGPAQAPRVQLSLEGHGLRLGAQSFAELTAQADVDLAPQGIVSFDLRSRGIQSAGTRIDEAAVRGNGRLGAHAVAVAVRGPQESVDLLLNGALAGGLSANASWRGEVRQLDLRSQQLGSWSLAAPAPLAASTAAVRLDGFCWRSGSGRLCADAAWAKAGAWSVRSTLAALPLSLLRPFLPPDLKITGDVDGTVQANGGAGGLVAANVDLRPGPGELRFPGEGGQTLAFRYEQASVRATAGPGGAGLATAGVVLPGVGTMTAELRLPRFVPGTPLTRQPLAGRLRANLSDLGFAAGFVPDLSQPAGTLTADLTLAGTVGAPRVAGQARLANGRADLPRLGLQLRDFRLTATGDGSGPLAIDAAVRSGPGTVTIRGQAGLIPSAATPVRLKVAGDRFQAMNTDQIRVQVSPQLDLTFDGKLARADGEVRIPQADVHVEERKSGPVAPSKDVVLVGAKLPGDQPRQRVGVAARVRLVLGREIAVAAFGLKAKPTGSLLLIEEPGKVTRGVGQVNLDEGTFKAYGQDLKIERGRLIFGGPLDNPGLDVRASRTADDGTIAGIEAKGTARAPEVSLWSDPAMSDTEALAYVLLGHPLEQATPAEGSLLANAANALEIRGGNLLAKKLAARYGLEEARIESTGSIKDASLVVGKYLSPRLYVVYGLGLFEAVNTFRIRYVLNHRFTLQAESGNNTSADMLYTIEH